MAVEVAARFADALRRNGLDVPLGSVTTFVDALAALGVERERDVYWAGRATLVRRPEDVAMYDRAFAAFWLGSQSEVANAPDLKSRAPPRKRRRAKGA